MGWVYIEGVSQCECCGRLVREQSPHYRQGMETNKQRKKHVKLEHIAKGTSDVTNGSAGDAGGGPRASSEKASPAAKRIAGRKKIKPALQNKRLLKNKEHNKTAQRATWQQNLTGRSLHQATAGTSCLTKP